MVQAAEAKSPNAEILEKLALEHLDTKSGQSQSHPLVLRLVTLYIP